MNTVDTLAISNHIYNGNLVAGAAAEGHGAITDWLGRGSRTGGAIAKMLEGIIPADWLPAPKEPATQLGRAVQSVAGIRYTAKPVRKSRDPEVRATETWLARWILVSLPVAEGVRAGEAFGEIVLVATLRGDVVEGQALNAVLECSTEPTDDPALYSERRTLCEAVRTSYHTLVSTQVHQASDITRWLGLTLRRRLNCIRYGRSYYIPAETRDVAEALVNAFRSDGWGHSWMYPALPVATTAQLSLGLAMSLALDVQDLATEVLLDRQEARDNGRGDMGKIMLQNRRNALDVIRSRVNFYSDRLGEARPEVEGPIRDLMAVFEEIQQYHNAQPE